MFHVQVVPKGPIWHCHINQLQLCYEEDIPSTSDASSESITESFISKKESILSSSISEDINTKEYSLSSITHASNPTTSFSDPPYTRDNPADEEDIQIFMFLSVGFIFCAYFLLSSGGVVYFNFSMYQTRRISYFVYTLFHTVQAIMCSFIASCNSFFLHF